MIKIENEEQLTQLADLVVASSIWRPASVQQEPETRLTQWRVYKVKSGEVETIHFNGWAGYEGRVCSAVQTYDPETKRGITASGRVYELVGNSGNNRDAAYVWGYWISRFNDPTVTDSTDEYDV